MKWERLGLIFSAKGKVSWAKSHALQPTPLVLGDSVRVFVGMRDEDGVSRVGWADLDLEDPSRIIGYSTAPAMDIGAPGAFDEFGVVPAVVFKQGNIIYMYYAGYQRGLKARFLGFGGLATSHDGGNSFKRIKRVPVFERTDKDLLFRCPHSMIKEKVYRFWYGGGDHFEAGEGKTLPIYDVHYLESDSLTTVPETGSVCVTMGESEYRIGRPCVVKRGNEYIMFYGYSNMSCTYQLGMARSPDGISWTRCDDEVNLPLGESGWDNKMMAYPGYFEVKGKFYLLYNGNDYGADGFGLARLVHW